MDRRQNLGLLLILALMAGSGWLLLREQSLSGVLEALGRIHPVWVALGLGLMLCFVGCEAMCSRLILGRLGHRLSYRKCLGYSDTLPLSSRKLVRISSKDTSWQPYHIEQIQDILFHTGFR